MADPEEEWFELVRSALNPLGGQVFDPTREIPAQSLTPCIVDFGLRLGLLTDRWVSNSAASTSSGSSVSAAEPEKPRDQDSSLEAAQRLWLFVILRLFLRRWRAGQGEPLLEARELLASWGSVGAKLWVEVRPRGLDDVFFGRKAIDRFIGRVEQAVALHESFK